MLAGINVTETTLDNTVRSLCAVNLAIKRGDGRIGKLGDKEICHRVRRLILYQHRDGICMDRPAKLNAGRVRVNEAVFSAGW